MFFLLRVAFWLTIVLVLLPSGGSQPNAKSNVGATDAIVAASAAILPSSRGAMKARCREAVSASRCADGCTSVST